MTATQTERRARRRAEATASQRQPRGPLGPGHQWAAASQPKHEVFPLRKTTTHWHAEATAGQPEDAGSVAPVTQKYCQLIDNL